jgi:NAD dependent epimerase/dehydratase family enzyme
MKTLREITGHKIGLAAPVLLLETGAFLIGTETELMLKSRWVIATKAMKEGFEFKYKLADEALKEIISSLPRRQCHLF